MKINLGHAEKIVDESQYLMWNGWDIVIWIPTKVAEYRVNGMYHQGKWGLKHTISLNDNGEWEIPKQYERLFN